MIKTLQEQLLNREQMRKARLIPIIIEFLIPPTEFVGKQLLQTDAEELKTSLQLLKPEIRSKDKIAESEIQISVEQVMYGISLTLLQLATTVLWQNKENQVLFKERYYEFRNHNVVQ